MSQSIVCVTLDHNCIIDLEENRPIATHLRTLITMHEQGQVCLRVVGIGASEMKPGGAYATNFAEFQQKLAAAGLGDVEILKPIGYFDITYWDWCVFPSETMLDLERRVHEVLFPNVEFDYAAYCTARGLDPADDADPTRLRRKWKNAKCDALALWCHIWHHGDIFVTTDRNFHKATKKPQLVALGAGSILYPDEALQTLQMSKSADWSEVQ